MARSQAIAAKSSLPILTTPALQRPTALACLGCEVLGRRRLLCSRVDQCKEIPHVGALGPVLLVGWLAMFVAFIVAVL